MSILVTATICLAVSLDPMKHNIHLLKKVNLNFMHHTMTMYGGVEVAGQ
jgi:hypothetical protein